MHCALQRQHIKNPIKTYACSAITVIGAGRIRSRFHRHRLHRLYGRTPNIRHDHFSYALQSRDRHGSVGDLGWPLSQRFVVRNFRECERFSRPRKRNVWRHRHNYRQRLRRLSLRLRRRRHDNAGSGDAGDYVEGGAGNDNIISSGMQIDDVYDGGADVDAITVAGGDIVNDEEDDTFNGFRIRSTAALVTIGSTSARAAMSRARA